MMQKGYRKGELYMNNKYEKKMQQWLICAGISLVLCVIFFFVMMNMEELPSKGFYVAWIMIAVFMVISIVMTNIYNAKSKNMNFDEYMTDRFENENGVKELKGFCNSVSSAFKNNNSTSSVKCPYCNSYNTSKISTMSKAIGAALVGVHALARNSKQWHCNNCKSDF